MKSAQTKKLEKEAAQRQQMRETLVELENGVKAFDAYIIALDEKIDEAVLNGDDDLAEEILLNQATAMDIQRDFKYIKNAIEQDVLTSEVLSSFATLPACLKNCASILAKLPKFDSLTKSMKDLRSKLGKTSTELKKMRDAVRKGGKTNTVLDYFDKSQKADSDNYQKCKERMEARLAAKFGGATNPVANPATNVAAAPANNVAGNAGNTGANGGNGGGAGIGDVLGMISDVNNGGNGGNN